MGIAQVQSALQSIAAQADTVAEADKVTAVDWIVAASVFVAGLALSMLVRWAVVSVLRKGTTIESMAERLVGRLAQALVALVGLSYALTVLGVRIGPLLGALGIGGIAVALALQETLKNLFAGVMLHAQRPVRMGEEVVTGEMQGTVIDITSRAVMLRSNSGRTLYVPNSLMLDREIVNLVRHGLRRTTLIVGVAYGTDLRVALDVIEAAAASAAGVLVDPQARVLCSNFGESSIDFEIDFWHGPAETERRVASSNVVIEVHAALGEAGITIPFPQRTIWASSEG